MRSFIIVFFILRAFLLHAQHTTTIQNPILSGFYPDPSIEKVGKDYYLINSTFTYTPGIPIFHSRDLKNWTQIGNVIDRDEQLDFMGERVSRGLFAPAISYYKGKYYVVCTDIDHEGNFIVTADKPEGPWSTITPLPEVRGIDPSLFFDEKSDQAYIIYNSDAPNNEPKYSGHRTIKINSFDYKTLKITSPAQILVNGGVNLNEKPVWIEGPHIYKRGDFYYLCAAEGGTSVNHSQVIFRSTNITGPYTPWYKNPILTQRHLDPNRPHPITSTGHADLFEGPDGNTYAVFLAVRPFEGNHYNLGRETFLAPVTWTPDQWPIINNGQEEVQYTYTFNWPEQAVKSSKPLNGAFAYSYNFSKDSLDQSFLYLRKQPSNWLTRNKKGLHLALQTTTLSDFQNPSFLAKRLQHHVATIITELEFSPKEAHETAGLAIFQGEKNYYYLAKTVIEGKEHINLYRAENEKKVLIASAPIKRSKRFFLKVEANNDQYAFHYALKPGKWQLLVDKQDGKYLSTETAGGFVGVTFGPYATSNGIPSNRTAIYHTLVYNGIQ